MCCAVIDVSRFPSLFFPTFGIVFPTGFCKNPLAFDSYLLAFMLQMQGKIVKSRGVFSKNSRESQRKWVGNLSFVSGLAPQDSALTNDKYFMENYVYARV